MNTNDETIPDPELNKIKRTELTAAKIIQGLQKELDALPPDQAIPPIPFDDSIVEDVVEYITKDLGLVATTTCPGKIAIGGEILNHAGLKEGRVGMKDNIRTLSFMYIYGDNKVRIIIITPNYDTDVDLRLLGMAIVWGLLANVPGNIIQTKPGTITDFFSINSYDLSKVIDFKTLDLFKIEYSEECEKKMSDTHHTLEKLQDQISDLNQLNNELLQNNQELQQQLEGAYENAYRWQMAALVCIVLSAVVLGISYYPHH